MSDQIVHFHSSGTCLLPFLLEEVCPPFVVLDVSNDAKTRLPVSGGLTTRAAPTSTRWLPVISTVRMRPLSYQEGWHWEARRGGTGSEGRPWHDRGM